MLSPNASQQMKQEKSKDTEDSESIKGRFGWKMIKGHPILYIIRVINGNYLKFVSIRLAETQLLRKYLLCFHADIYTCISVKSQFVTESEAKLLTEINQKHNSQVQKPFIACKDRIVRLEDVCELNMFIKVFYKRFINSTPGCSEKFGFIRINSVSVVPYCAIDDKKYLPLFYFEGETDTLRRQAIKLENWDLAYLKLCCKIQGISYELHASDDSCIVSNFDEIKSSFPPNTNFEEYWPAKSVYEHLLNNDSNRVNPSGCWAKTPHTVLITNSATSQQNSSSKYPTTVIVSNIPVSNSNVAALNQSTTTTYPTTSGDHVVSPHYNHVQRQRSTIRGQMQHYQQQHQLPQQKQQKNRDVVDRNALITYPRQQNTRPTVLIAPAYKMIDPSPPPKSPGPSSI